MEPLHVKGCRLVGRQVACTWDTEVLLGDRGVFLMVYMYRCCWVTGRAPAWGQCCWVPWLRFRGVARMVHSFCPSCGVWFPVLREPEVLSVAPGADPWLLAVLE